jgi:iron-sulfur cluster assembly protein
MTTIQQEKPSTISLTEAAATYIQAKLDQNSEYIGFCLATKDSGCTKKKYAPTFVKAAAPTDKKFTSHGIDIYIPQSDLPYLIGTVIDYGKEGLNQTLKYTNPNVKVACGCGESFDIES